MCLFAPDIFSPQQPREAWGPYHLLTGHREGLNGWNWPKSARVCLAAGLGGINCRSDLQKRVRLFRQGQEVHRCQSANAVWSCAQRNKSDVSASVQNPHCLSHEGPTRKTLMRSFWLTQEMHILMCQAERQSSIACQGSGQQASLNCLRNPNLHLYTHPHPLTRARAPAGATRHNSETHTHTVGANTRKPDQ